MNGHSGHLGGDPHQAVILAVAVLAAVLAVAGYLRALSLVRVPWPQRRIVAWVGGCLVGLGSVMTLQLGGSFESHMIGHLGLGMLAPLLLMLAAPITLLFASLPPSAARRLSGLLRSRPLTLLTEPIVAATLNVGGLWLLYATPLYAVQHEHPLAMLLVHLHMFAAGYLFTVSIVSVDPLPHRRSFLHRAVVLVLALAAHDILAKVVYAHPPDGVNAQAAQQGALWMYYGGDGVDLALAVLLCLAWYRRRRRSTRVSLARSWLGPGRARVSSR